MFAKTFEIIINIPIPPSFARIETKTQGLGASLPSQPGADPRLQCTALSGFPSTPRALRHPFLWAEGDDYLDSFPISTDMISSPLQHFTNQREEFEGTRESILVWLTEMDLQLTNVEHFSESDADDKMRQLNVRAASSAPLQRWHL